MKQSKHCYLFNILLAIGSVNSCFGQVSALFTSDFKPVIIWIYPEENKWKCTKLLDN